MCSCGDERGVPGHGLAASLAHEALGEEEVAEEGDQEEVAGWPPGGTDRGGTTNFPRM